MTDTVLDAIVASLADAGIDAVRAYPNAALSRSRGPVVCVGMRSNRLLSPGMGDYLGQRAAPGAVSELYGLRAECAAALDIFSPDDAAFGAAGCVRCAEAVSSALAALPSGLRLRALRLGETEFDGETGMFRMTAEMDFTAFLVREMNADTGEFTDFTLKGVLK